MNVSLNLGEQYIGAMVGVMRRISAMKRGRPETHGPAGPHYWQVDIEAALAEMAAAKALNVYWKSPVLDRVVNGTTDLEGANVRSTQLPDGGLILYKTDPDELPFVLVRGGSGQYDIPGWYLCGDGKKPQFWRTDLRDPCYVVPGKLMRPLNTLKLPSLYV